MSRFLQKLEHCSGENVEVLHNHLKQSKLEINELGDDLTYNSWEVITVVVSSFKGQLGNWAANHVDDSFKLNIIDALTKYVGVACFNEDLES